MLTRGQRRRRTFTARADCASQLEALVHGLAAHFEVSVPTVHPWPATGEVHQLGKYTRAFDGGRITLWYKALHAGNLYNVLAHEFTHHLDYERGTYRGLDPENLHGRVFLARWREVEDALQVLRQTTAA